MGWAIIGLAFIVWLVLVLFFTPRIDYKVSHPTRPNSDEFLHVLQATCQAAIHFHNKVEVLTNGAQFYWLSASRPITGAGTTPFPVGVTDLQAWTRDEALDPDWLRVGTDIVEGTTPPTFNTAFSLDGTVLPEPATVLGVFAGLAFIGVRRRFAAIRKSAS